MKYPSIPKNEAQAAALALGRFVLTQARETTYGLRFPEINKEGEVEYHDSLYKGAAGVGLVLLDIFLATEDSDFAKSAEQVGYDLIESTPGKNFIHPGLFSGHAGHILFYIQAAHTLKNPIFLEEACRLGDVLADRPFHGTDIVTGAAGTGLVFLSLYSTFQNKEYLSAAHRALAFLKETSEKDSGGICWSPLIPEWGDSPDRFVPHTGLAHGVSGICLYLTEWIALGLDEGAMDLSCSSFSWLDSHKIQNKSGLFWPVSSINSKLRYHWCHGTTGIAHAYLAKYRQQKDIQALEVARKAALTSLKAARQSQSETWIHCHGSSGVLELLLDLQDVDSNPKWNQALSEFWPCIRSFVESIESLDIQEGTGTSLSLGLAGLIRVLLRMAGKSVYPILTARRPRQRQAQSQALRKFYPIFQVSKHRENREYDSVDALPSAYLPRIAGQLKDHKYQVVLKHFTLDEQRDLQDIVHQHPGSGLLRKAVKRIEKSSREMENRYQDLIAPKTLNPELHGPVIRELSGICLRSGGKDHSTEILVDRQLSQYIDMLHLMLERLEKDRETRLGTEVQGKVVRMELLSSDPHRRGQKVVALTFSGGQEFIYKSRSMALERHLVGTSRQGEIPSLAELINRGLQPRVKGAAIPTHRIIPAGTHYGFAERVQTRLDTIELTPLVDSSRKLPENLEYPIRATVLKEKEQEAFWYTAGLVAGFAMGLGLADLHSENLICGSTKESPKPGFHLIDIEMAFYEYDCLRDSLLVDLTAVEEPERFARGFHKHTGFDHEVKICGSAGESWVFRNEDSGYRLVPGSRALTSLDYAHLAKNSDGSFGYRPFLPAFLRGMIDVRQQFKVGSQELSSYLSDHLNGEPVRLMAKATRCYVHGIRKSRGRDYPASGSSWSSEFALPFPLWESELQQLKQGDIPYFFQFLGKNSKPSPEIYWFDGPPLNNGIPASLGKVYRGIEPFWSIVERQSDIEVLVRSLADAVAFVAPQEPFELRDDRFGLRVFRSQKDKELWFIAILDEGRLVARVEGRGGASLWLE